MEQKQSLWNIRRKRKKLQALQIHIRRGGGGQEKSKERKKKKKIKWEKEPEKKKKGSWSWVTRNRKHSADKSAHEAAGGSAQGGQQSLPHPSFLHLASIPFCSTSPSLPPPLLNQRSLIFLSIIIHHSPYPPSNC